MSSEPTTHIVFFAIEAWGHTRPLSTLAIRLVQERPLYVTFFTARHFVKRVEDEVSRSIGPGDEHIRDLIRVAALDSPDGPFTDPKHFNTYMDLFAEAYKKVVDGKPVTCAVNGKEIKPVIPPEALIMDFFCLPALESARKISKRPIKVYAWMSAQAAFMIHPYAPVRLGGRKDLRPKIAEEVARTGRPHELVADEILNVPVGELVNLPGLPTMYDHELYPQQVPLKGVLGFVTLMMHGFLEQCDGLFLGTAAPYEPEAVSHITEWYAETSRDVYTVGHLLPTSVNAAAGEEKQSEKASEIARFLQKSLETDGPHSVLYISFGSVFWPMEPEKIWAFLDAVIEKNIPFIFSYASPFATIPDEVFAKVNAYGRGLLSKWSPQQTILAHPATGWFLTHGGQNSVLESITHGVPMIFWPFAADQPTNAARLSHVLEASYELFEVRTEPHGLKPVHRLGKAPLGTLEALREEARTVLGNAYGEDGSHKRANMKKLHEAVVNVWSEDGVARQDLRRFVATLSK